jgi:hypothetical protein
VLDSRGFVAAEIVWRGFHIGNRIFKIADSFSKARQAAGSPEPAVPVVVTHKQNAARFDCRIPIIQGHLFDKAGLLWHLALP